MQDFIAFALVFVAALSLLIGFFLKHAAEPLSRWLLSQGRVKWALRLRRIKQRFF